MSQTFEVANPLIGRSSHSDMHKKEWREVSPGHKTARRVQVEKVDNKRNVDTRCGRSVAVDDGGRDKRKG